ncbi:hypothetical protein [Pseudomonas helvetica]
MSASYPITLYTADTPNGQKISIFLKEAAIDCEKVKFNAVLMFRRMPDQ